MKYSVFFKILAAFLVISLVFIFSFFKYMKSVQIAIVVNSEKIISEGFLLNLEKELTSNPSKWDTILKKHKDEGVEVLPIDKIHLTTAQKAQFNNGKIVVFTGKEYQFLNLVIARKTAYKKIGNTPYALAYYYADPNKIISHYMAPALNQITENLLSKPEDSWVEETRRLEKIYGFPIDVYESASEDIPSKITQSLLINNVAFETNKNTSQIGIIYYAFNGKILKVGPLNYSSITARISDVIGYFVLAFFIFSFLLITFLSQLFVRNMKKIYHITENFSHGHFDFHQQLSATSVLFGLYTNIISMGMRIKDLIKSHKQMCQFIAHEIRTPLSTILLATESIKRKNSDDLYIKKQLASIVEDVNDMNQIVSTFLVYSKMQSTELKLRQTKTDLILWLQKLLEPYYDSRFEISFNYESAPLNAYIDKNILKHAITNLITNAMKFARFQISLSVEQDNNQVLIHVDDDGPGLPSNIDADIFSEYVSTEDDEADDKHIGLGLAIVKKVVNFHAGSVTATQSPILKGGRFTISLPRLDSE